jgi:hypothetical protein
MKQEHQKDLVAELTRTYHIKRPALMKNPLTTWGKPVCLQEYEDS